MLDNYCAGTAWDKQKYCRASCYAKGKGYTGDSCCPASGGPPPPSPSPPPPSSPFVCMDKSTTGFGEGSVPWSCTKLNLNGYCTDSVNGAAVMAACPVTCGVCTPPPEPSPPPAASPSPVSSCPASCGDKTNLAKKCADAMCKNCKECQAGADACGEGYTTTKMGMAQKMGKTKKVKTTEECSEMCDEKKKCKGFHFQDPKGKKKKAKGKCMLFKKGVSQDACAAKTTCCMEPEDPCKGLKKKKKKKCEKENA
jgi:hypothetical protein